MKHNMGNNEKAIRLIGGAILFLIGWLVLKGFGVFVSVVTTTTVIGLILTVIGLVGFITGIVSYCPINALLHHNSCEACKIGETHAHMPV